MGNTRTRRGSALLPALMIVTVLGVLSMAWLQLSLTKNREHVASADAKRAFYIAEAGLAEAFAGLVAGKSGNVGGPGLPAQFGRGLFWVKAKAESDGKVSLTSTGLAGTGRVSLTMIVENAADTVASKGAFGSQRVDVLGGAKIDSFDSRITTTSGSGPGGLQIGGPGAPDQPTESARVGSNQDILVRDPPATMPGTLTEIHGDARPGPSGTVLRGLSTLITGSTAPSDATVSLPPISVPSIPSNGNVDYALASPPLSLPTGSTAFGSIRVRDGATVTVQGPTTLVVDSLQVDPNGHLVLDSRNGPIHLYVRDYLYLAAGSTLNTPDKDPGRLSLQVNASVSVDRDGDGIVDPPVRLQSTGRVYATIYAPLANVAIPPLFELFGAVAAQRLTVGQGAKVHFDVALTVANARNGGIPRFAGWRIVELPPSPLIDLRLDPLLVMKASGMTPPLAPNAHYDVGTSPPSTLASPLQIR